MSVRWPAGLTPRRVTGWLCLLWLAWAVPAHAQTLSTADLEGTWSFFQLVTTGGDNSSVVRAYRGQLTFGANGSVSSAPLTDGQGHSVTVTSGGLTVAANGFVEGALGFNGSPVDDGFTVSGARILGSGRAIVGIAFFFDELGSFSGAGRFDLAKLEPGQVFTVNGALAGTWSYHELSPVDQSLPGGAGGVSWSRGVLTFATDDAASGQSCARGSLVRSDGSVRAAPGASGSFGCATLDPTGAVTGTTAGLDGRITTDLILGLTEGADTQSPGVVAMSRIAGGMTFSPADLAGSWSVYVQRVGTEHETTVQVGQFTFSAAGAFAGGFLGQPFGGSTGLVPAPASTVAVAGNGSVTARLVASGAIIGPEQVSYVLRGVVRASKDVVTGVLTVQSPDFLPTSPLSHGLVTLVRDATLFDLAQSAYTVTEGNSVKVTVLRSGNLAGTAKVTWSAAAPPGQLTGPVTGVLTFPTNTASQAFTVTTAQNSAVDGNRSVTLTLSNPTGASAVLGTTTNAPLAILDDDKGGTFKLSASGYTVAETVKSVPIVIQRTAGTGMASGIVVSFALTGGTAVAGRDYTLPANTSVTFGATDTARTVLVPILDNKLVDGARTFTFALTNVSANGTLAATQIAAPVTITDDEVGGTLAFSTAASSVLEGNTSTITVVRGPGGAGGVLVDFTTADGTAQAGRNYIASSGTLTFGAGNVSAVVQVPTLNDPVIDGDTTVLLTLGNPRSSAPFVGPTAKLPVLGALERAVLTIKDAQKGLQFASSNYGVKEALTTAMVSVVRSGPMTDTATVRYSTSDGAGPGAALAGVHYTPASGVLTFPPGVATQSFGVKIMPDKVATGSKSLLLLLSGANSSAAPPVRLGPRASAVLTIVNTDAAGTVAFGGPAFGGTEGGAAVVTVTRTGGAGVVGVDYATSDQPCAVPPCPGLAQADADYDAKAGTLNFAPGETTKSILIPLSSDSLVEGNETFLITLSNPQGGATLGTPSQAVVTITDKNQGGVIQLASAALTVTAPASGNVSVPVMLTRTGTNLGQANVLLMTGTGTAVPGLDYLPIATTVVFADGQTSRLVPLVVLPGDAVTGNVTVPILLSNASAGATLGATRGAVLTIMDAEPSVGFGAPAYTVTEGGLATIKVVRGGALAGTVTVPFATSDDSATAPADYASRQGTLVFAPGVASQTFTVTTARRPGDNGDRALNLALGTPNPSTVGFPSGGNAATLTIVDVDRAGQFQLAPTSYSVVEGSAVTLTVTRTGGTLGAVNVPWQVTGTGVTPRSGNVSFAAGQASKTATLTSAANTVLDGNRSVSVTLGAPIVVGPLAGLVPSLGTDTTATVNILDNEAGGSIQFTNVTPAVAENVTGGLVNLVVTRTGANLAGGVLVDYTVTADPGVVSSNTSGTLTFATPAATTATVPVRVVNNAGAQLDRLVVVTLSNPRSGNGYVGSNSPRLGTPASTMLTVTDSLPHVQFSAGTFSVTGGDTATITVTRSGPASAPPVVVNFTTADGSGLANTDYTPAAGALTITGAAGKGTFPVVTKDDGLLAGSRTVLLGLTGVTGGTLGAPSTATLTIQDKQSAGTVQLANATASVLEGGVVRVTVTRTGANLVGGVTVGWSATGGTATAGDDFTPASGTLSFGPGVSSQSVDITTIDDGLPEGTETVVLSLDPPTGGAALGSPSQMTVLIIDTQQTVAFSSATTTVGETTPSAALQILRAGVPSGPLSVRARTIDGTALAGQDYTARDEIVTFQPGEIARPFVVSILTPNAATRNGNRALTIALSEPSAGVSLGAPNASTLTIMDFRPDLVITSVSAPSGALTGKAVSTPSTVKNIGPVAAPPFSVGLFLVRSDDPGAQVPGAGSLVTVQSVPGLAAGASASFPTQITLEDDFPSGEYYVSAVANFSQSVAESDPTNNGRSSAPAKLTIDRTVGKFKSASASFSQTTPSPPSAGRGLPPTQPCDLEGTVDLTGTFAITSQTRNVATGQANLTGTLSGFAVQYLISFTAQLDIDPTADTVFGTLDRVVFRVLGTSVTGSGNGSFTGSLDNGFNADVAGQFVTSTSGACAFTGSLSAEGQTSFQLRYATSAEVGALGFDPSPTVAFPVKSPAYSLIFKVFIDDFPAPSTVLFTGPPGSGLNRTPADPVASAPDPNRRRFAYVAPARTGAAPGGVYSVLYKGETKTFTLPPYNPATSLVVIYPTVTLVDFNMPRIDWVYRNPVTGANLSAAPSFMTGLTVRVQTTDHSLTQPQSPSLPPSTTFFDFTCGGLCSSPTWSQVEAISFQYTDVVGNQYEVVYPKAYFTELGPRLTTTYAAANCSDTNPGCHRTQRLFTFFTTVPAGSVDTTSCAAQAPGGPFAFSILNESRAGAPPYGDLTCVERLGTTTLPGTSVAADVFGKRTDLDVPPDGVAYPPGLGVGTQFLFIINRRNGAQQFDVRSVDPAEANGSTDVVFIPSDATPALKPSGFTLADAKLGQRQTFSWTAPPFSVSELFIEAVVHTTATGNGVFCTVQDFTTQLDPAATQGSFTLPATCNGKPVLSATACVVYINDEGRARTEACWTWR